ncbi:hypothetical protein FNV43_RR09110 [Rhamnella rubrinervis]|uniref:STI1 domain-containing protein n=1 Tax=Rhamnella rubrinervis TaxID=2594499 RepID=A0A8K0H9F4_9ROSA|nr:hypothetical protein FNV43_RR09110 [Rhamnella rubrinervis]
MGLVKMLRSVIMVVLVVGIVSLVEAQENTCASKLVPCYAYLNYTTSPPASCCDPIRETVANELDCLCNLYNSPGFLASLGLNISQALRLSHNCGVPDEKANCNATASSPNSQPPPPPGVPGGDNGSGAVMLVWTGILPLLLLFWIRKLLESTCGESEGLQAKSIASLVLLDSAELNQLRHFVEQCKADPSILTDPSLSFFRDYLVSLGAKLPPSAFQDPDTKSKSYVVDESDEDMVDNEETQGNVDEEDDEIVESDVELEGETVEPDHDPPQKMGDSSIEVTDENRDASQEAKAQAVEAISEDKLEEAIEHLTKAILLNPTSAIMYATRATVYIKMKKPNAAIRDANAALEINLDSAKGYKSRGIARAMLGQWEEAAKDLHLASKLDYDEEINAVLKKVEPNAHRIEEHRRKYERLRKEREEKRIERERQRRRAEAQATYEKAKKQEQSSSGEKPGPTPGGFPGGGMPGGVPGNVDFSKILNDPELMAAFSDPDVMAALQDVMKNPANLAKHQANPKVAPVIAKMMNKFGGPK